MPRFCHKWVYILDFLLAYIIVSHNFSMYFVVYCAIICMLNKRSSVHRKIVRYDWPNERTAKKQLHYLCLRHGLCVIMR